MLFFIRAFLGCTLLSLSVITPVLCDKKHHALARHGDVKYKKDFDHLDSVNPNAPKGGTLRIGVVGTFDTTNPYLIKGTAPVGLSRFSEKYVFESLMFRNREEPFTLYAWLAESVEIADDFSWITFHLNPTAKWEDGTPVTPDDVIFSHKMFKEKAGPNFQLFHKKIKTIEQKGERSIKFIFKREPDGTYNSELPYIIAMMTVLQKAHFKGKIFEKTSLGFIPGSGAYKISEIKPGHRIVYERRKNHWAKDLNIMRGQHNFDEIQVIYYRDLNVARMAFLSGEFDYIVETKPNEQQAIRQKSNNPNSPFKIIEYNHEMSVPLSTYCMNNRRFLFKDQRVRRALILAFDFNWVNKNLLHNTVKRNRSFFQNTELEHKGMLSEAEYKLLEPFKNDIPQEVFYKPYNPPTIGLETETRKTYRQDMKKAADLLKEAGFIIKNGHLIHKTTGEPFVFELMLYNKSDEKLALSYARSLKRLGITMKIRTLDPAQYEIRRLKYDYDMILQAWFAGHSPGNELQFYWGSKMAYKEGGRNYPGVQSPVIDYLCHYIADAKTREDLMTGCHALDRVLMWGEYFIPLYYTPTVFAAHQTSIAPPLLNPKMAIYLAMWWSTDKK